MAKNFISNKDESVAMFENPFLERLTRIHFTIPLILFVPVIIYCLFVSLVQEHLNVLQFGGFILFGVCIWTLTEYVMHRFVFHWQPPGKFGAKMHFIFHGVHHDYP